jgi:hypothetical protein
MDSSTYSNAQVRWGSGDNINEAIQNLPDGRRKIVCQWNRSQGRRGYAMIGTVRDGAEVCWPWVAGQPMLPDKCYE